MSDTIQSIHKGVLESPLQLQDHTGTLQGFLNGVTQSQDFGVGALFVASNSAFRTYIGAGTSSFNGAYSSLTGIPSAFVPSTHAASHGSAGSDPVSPASIGAATAAQGTKADNAAAINGILKCNGSGIFSVLTDNSSNWDTAYADRNKWNGDATGLNPSTGRASLALGTLATQNGTFSGTSSGTNTGDQDLSPYALLASPALSGVPTVPTASAGTNTTQIASTAFVAGAISTAVTGLLNFKGSTDCSGNPNYPSAVKGDSYIVSVAGKIGGASGTSVDVGDWYIAEANNAGGTEASVGSSWGHMEHNLVGALLASNNLSDIGNATTARSNLVLGNVENTALSTWAGSGNITTLGTVTSGTFSGTLGAISGASLTALTAANITASTSAGRNILNLTNPSAISFIKIAADNTVSTRTPAQVLSDIGAQASGSYALTTSNLSQFAATTSAQLRGVLSDENGTGVALFDSSTSATFITPILGTPTSGNLVNCTFPTLNQNTTGSAANWTTARNLAGNSVDGSANAAFANKFIVQGTVDAGLSAAQFLGALGTGILKSTTTTGVLSIAVAGDFPTLNQNTSGLAGTATALATARTINGVSFNGTANITVAAAGSTLSDTVTVAKGGTGAATLAAHGVLLGNGTGAVAVTGAGIAGQVLTSNGASADPTFQSAAGITNSAGATIVPVSNGTNLIASSIVDDGNTTVTAGYEGGVISLYGGTFLFNDVAFNFFQIPTAFLYGTGTNDSANTGGIGEYVLSTVSQSTPIALTTATPKTVTSISLAAGDWDVTAIGCLTGASTGTEFDVAIGTTTNSMTGTALGQSRCQTPTVSLAGADATLMIPSFRVSIASTTTYYLIVQETFTLGSPAAYGRISARRVR